MFKRAFLSQITPKNHTRCLSLRNNAALLHSSATSALSAREQAVYVEALYLRENTSALADIRKRNTAGAQCVFYMLAAIS